MNYNRIVQTPEFVCALQESDRWNKYYKSASFDEAIESIESDSPIPIDMANAYLSQVDFTVLTSLYEDGGTYPAQCEYVSSWEHDDKNPKLSLDNIIFDNSITTDNMLFNADLCDGHFSGSMFKNFVFDGVNLGNFDFSGATFENVIFSYSQMKSCNFRNADFKNCIFEKCEINGVDLDVSHVNMDGNKLGKTEPVVEPTVELSSDEPVKAPIDIFHLVENPDDPGGFAGGMSL